MKWFRLQLRLKHQGRLRHRFSDIEVSLFKNSPKDTLNQLHWKKIEWRSQGKTNRQVGEEETELPDSLAIQVAELQTDALDIYNKLLKAGIAKECARMILPLNTSTTLYMAGTVRSWIHFLSLRTKEDTQKEHRYIANEIKKIFIEEFPITSCALNWI